MLKYYIGLLKFALYTKQFGFVTTWVHIFGCKGIIKLTPTLCLL